MNDNQSRGSRRSYNDISGDIQTESLRNVVEISGKETILDLFQRSCDVFQDRIAIEWNESHISYIFIDLMANAVARYLLDHGLPRNSVIAAVLQDRIQIIAVLIATLKTGHIFTPLDPAAPVEHLRKIITHLSPVCIITESSFSQELIDICDEVGSQFIILASEGDVSGKYDLCLQQMKSSDHETVPCVFDPEEACYIYYTSGSTGTPKGIVGRFKSLSHFIRWEIATFEVNSRWRFSQFTRPTFDAFLRDVFVPLCSGGTICLLLDDMILFNARALSDWIDRTGVNLIHCVPSLFRLIIAGNPDAKRFASLKYILMAGEVLHPSDVKRWMNGYGNRTKLVNLYGPTETTMVKFYHIVQEADAQRGFIPIGKPMSGTRAIVLDDNEGVCPQGIVGELYIRTAYSTLGYYKYPDLTNEVFVRNPFSNDPKDIIYKTGDLVRLLSDGDFQFIGRKDNQVKIRGYRVDLGEIEELLHTHAQIKSAVVLDWEGVSGDKRLIAYIVSDTDHSLITTELRDFMKRMVPEHMIPSMFVMIDALPLSANGKVNRHALPLPERTTITLGSVFVAPSTPTEEMLASIWGKVLDLEQVGIHDNFFELGGHSLLATQVISRIFDVAQIELPLHAIFERPTIADLAIEIIQCQAECRQSLGGRVSRFIGENLPENLDQLSDREIDLLLSDLLEDEQVIE
jgi:amino acid adenylation domain-containing protein